ncbi:MAG: SRPBCC family protein [Planktotalea sp.]|uniref:SRPBCC family protein n=1 Tax=Planktotalea sp. TaxID=2029877 RepID=UPI003C739C38
MTLLTTAAIGAGVLAAALLATQLLPREVTVLRSAQVQASPSDVIALLASNEGYQKINPYKSSDPALKITLFGPSSGVGSGFHFDGKDGKGSQTVSAVTDSSVRYDIDMGAMGQPKQIVEVRPSAGGSAVEWRMEADLGRNPIARIFGLFMDGMIGKTLDQGLSNLNTAA